MENGYILKKEYIDGLYEKAHAVYDKMCEEFDTLTLEQLEALYHKVWRYADEAEGRKDENEDDVDLQRTIVSLIFLSEEAEALVKEKEASK